MSSCGCDNLPDIFFLDTVSDYWLGGLQAKSTGNWKKLYRCPECGHQFSVDVWDKYHHQVVVRIADSGRWEQEADSEDLRKALLLKSRGVVEEEPCVWAGCEKRRIRGVVYCLDHLWNTGARW